MSDVLPLPPAGADGARDFSDWQGWDVLGRPSDPAAYAFKLPEGVEPSDRDRALHDRLRPALHKAGLSQQQLDALAPEVSAAFAEALAGDPDAENEAATAALAEMWGGADAVSERLDAVRAFVRDYGGEDLRQAIADTPLGADPKFLDFLWRASRAGAPGAASAPSPAAELETLWRDRAYLDRRDPRHRQVVERATTLYRQHGENLRAFGEARNLTPEAATAALAQTMDAARADPKHPYVDRTHPRHGEARGYVKSLQQAAGRGAR